MKYNPKIHNRQSIRLKGWDYSQKGKYFITINIQNRLHLLGNINNGKIILNDASIFDMMDWFKTMTTNEYIRGVKNKIGNGEGTENEKRS